MIELGEADIKRACLELGYDEEFTELMTDKEDQVQIRDSNGTVFNTVEHPVAVVDNIDDELLVLLKIGEDSIMSEYYNIVKLKMPGINIEKVVLPRNQELIDKIFNNTGYINKYYEARQRVKEWFISEE